MAILSTWLPVVAWAGLLFMVLMIAVNLLLARRRSWIMAIVRIGMTIASFVVALLAANPIASMLSNTVYKIALPKLGADVASAVDSVPAGEEGLKLLVALSVAPFVFFLVFVLLRALMCIPGAMVAKCVPIFQKKESKKQVIAMPLGGLNGLLIAILLLIPMCGFLVLGGHMLTTISTVAQSCESPQVDELVTDLDATPAQLVELGDEMENNVLVTIVHSTLGKPVFRALTTGTTQAAETHNKELELNLEEELGGLIESGIYLVDAVDSFRKENYSEKDKDRLFRAEESLLESEWRTMLVTDALTASATSWRRGEPFAGIKRPTLDANIDPTVNCLLDILANESDLTLEKDIHDILDVLGDFLVCNLLSSSIDPQQMLVTMNERGLLTTTMAKLDANPRLAAVADELKALSVRLLTNMLGLDELKNGEHAELMNNVATELTDVLDLPEEERHAVISEALGNTFNDYGFEVPPDVANEMADQMIVELGTDGEITGDELTDYLVNHMDDATGLIPDDIPDIPLE